MLLLSTEEIAMAVRAAMAVPAAKALKMFIVVGIWHLNVALWFVLCGAILPIVFLI